MEFTDSRVINFEINKEQNAEERLKLEKEYSEKIFRRGEKTIP